jgi:hypothetical protein
LIILIIIVWEQIPKGMVLGSLKGGVTLSWYLTPSVLSSSSYRFLYMIAFGVRWGHTHGSWTVTSFENHRKNVGISNVHYQIWIFFFLWYWGLNSGPTPWATPSALFLVMGFFWDRVLQTICSGWLWTVILLISASWVARVTGVSHWSPAQIWILYLHLLHLSNSRH